MTHGRKAKQQGEDTREFDTTSCTRKRYGHQVHRDYAAHFFRWGFATRFINNKTSVLEIGCGADQPLANVLHDSLGHYPKKMVSVDIDDIKPKYNFGWFDLRANFNFVKQWHLLKPTGPFDVVVSFEVIEHMQKKSGIKLLKGARELMHKDGIFLLSTPVFDPRVGMAKNHIHEWHINELQKEIERAGLRVEHRFGTFMTALKAKKVSVPAHKETWQALSNYYGHDVLACFLAPLYPDEARNNVWVLRKA